MRRGVVTQRCKNKSRARNCGLNHPEAVHPRKCMHIRSQFTVAPEARMMSCHLFVSACMKAVNSAG